MLVRIQKSLLLAGFLAISAMFIMAKHSGAQETLRIVAVVNDEVISAYDLGLRLRFVMVTAGIPITEASEQRLAPQVLRLMIDEKIKRQEAKRLSIEPNQDAVAARISLFEQRSNLALGSLPEILERNGASIEPFVQQLEAETVWLRTISARFASDVNISDEEIDAVIQDLKERAGKSEFRFAEIFIPSEGGDPRQAQQTIQRLLQELQNGADFNALAQSFSRAPSAVNGGDLGYMQLEDLGSELSPVAGDLSPGQMTRPIETPLGIYLIAMVDERTSPGLPTGEIRVTLSQLHTPLSPSADATAIEAATATATQVALGIQGCSALEAAGAELGSPLSGPVGTVSQDNLPSNIRSAIDNLAIGQPSAPVRTADGLVVLMVCERTGEANEEQIREQIRRRILNERLENLARQYLRDLKRTALVEIRQ